MPIKAITPTKAKKLKMKNIPMEIIRVIDKMILDNTIEGIAKIEIESIVKIVRRETKLTRKKIFDNNMLDIEDLYRSKGFKVQYVPGAYYETFEPYFTFEK